MKKYVTGSHDVLRIVYRATGAYRCGFCKGPLRSNEDAARMLGNTEMSVMACMCGGKERSTGPTSRPADLGRMRASDAGDFRTHCAEAFQGWVSTASVSRQPASQNPWHVASSLKAP